MQAPAQPKVSKLSPSEVQKDLHTENQSKVLQGNEQQESLVHHLMQWATEVLATINYDSKKTLSSDVLCSTTFSLLGNNFPNIPVEHHYAYLRFICRAILHISPKTVSCAAIYFAGLICTFSEIFVKLLTKENW